MFLFKYLMMYNNTNFVYNIRYFDMSDIVLYIYDFIVIVNKPFNSLQRFFSNSLRYFIKMHFLNFIFTIQQ